LNAQVMRTRPGAPESQLALAWRSNPPLAALVLAMLALLAVSVVGLVFDPRVITGAPAWMKPAKFAASIAIYGATLLWLLRFIPDRPRLVAGISWLIAGGLALEMVLITVQVVRGSASHFNHATPFDSLVFRIMGGVIAGVWLLTVVVAVLLARRDFAAPAIVWAVRLGIVAALIGMAVAFLMPQPTPDQMALLDETESSPVIGAHAVGVEDGGPGLPIVGWSTTGGDLRVPHFVGMHGLQAMVLFGWALTSFGPSWLSARGKAQLAIVAGLGWIALTLLLTWQALRAQPVIAPDGRTLAALGVLVVIGGLLAGAILVRASGRTTS
jgi:hypothetical protein